MSSPAASPLSAAVLDDDIPAVRSPSGSSSSSSSAAVSPAPRPANASIAFRDAYSPVRPEGLPPSSVLLRSPTGPAPRAAIDISSEPAEARPRAMTGTFERSSSSESDDDDGADGAGRFVNAAQLVTPLSYADPAALEEVGAVAVVPPSPTIGGASADVLTEGSSIAGGSAASATATAAVSPPEQFGVGAGSAASPRLGTTNEVRGAASTSLLAIPERTDKRRRASSVCVDEALPSGLKVPAPYARETSAAAAVGDAAAAGAMTSPRQHYTATSSSQPTSSRASGENPAGFSSPTYSMMPRYGFPPSPLPHVAQAESTHHRGGALQQQQLCEQQWATALRGVQMLAHAVASEMVPLRRLCRKFGIAPHARGIVWLTLSGAAVKVEENEGFCAALLERFGGVPELTAEEIEKDLERTFPEHPLFAPGAQGYLRLRRVLHALVHRNPLLGYCQGFNFIAGFLLLFLDDEEATFWAACHILEVLLPNDYYANGLVGMRVDQAVLTELLKAHAPKLSAHLAAAGFDAGIFIPTWVMPLFVSTLPVSAAVPVWDYMLTRDPSPEPSSVPLAICIALFKMHGDALMACEDAGEMLVALTQRVQMTCDGLKLVKIAHDLKLQPATVRALRRKHRGRIAHEAAERAAAIRRIESTARITLQNRATREQPRDATGSRDGAAPAGGGRAPSPDQGSPGDAAASPRTRPQFGGSRAKDSFVPSPFVGAVRVRAESVRGQSAARTLDVVRGSESESDDGGASNGAAQAMEEMQGISASTR